MYPLWADAVGWVIGLLPVFVIFVVAFKQIYNGPEHLGIKDRVLFLLKPTEEWGPAGRPCLYPDRYQNENTASLMEGAIVEALPFEDNGTTFGAGSNRGAGGDGGSGGVSTNQKEAMQL